MNYKFCVYHEQKLVLKAQIGDNFLNFNLIEGYLKLQKQVKISRINLPH